MHERTTFRRLGVIVSTVLVTLGLAAFPAYTLADNGGNGNGNGGNGNGNGGNGNGNGNGNANGNGNGNGNDNGSGNGNGNGNDNGVEQVVICHVPPGNPGNEHTIIVGETAVDAHVDNHDDTVGPCDIATSTSSTTSTSTTSTSPAVAPVALPDILLQDATVGQPFNLNVLANDDLGNPVATITAHTFDPTLQAGCIGLSFDPATGVIVGTPTQSGTCPFAYVIQNSAGFSLTQVLVPVLD
jgi:Putative Ig domain